MRSRAPAIVPFLLSLAAACGEPAAAPPRPAPFPSTRTSATAAPSAHAPAAPSPVQSAAAEPSAAHGDPQRNVADAATPLAEVACRFEAVRESAGKPPERWEWFLWRRDGRVETRETLSGAGEAWERDPRTGRVSGHLKHFHAERRTIEYVSGDLAALGATTDWEVVTSLFPEARLESLRRTGAVEILGRPAVRYAGRLGAAEYDVTWVPSLRLPGAVRKAADGQFVSFRLREAHALDAAPWTPPDASSYRVTEFSDVGCGSTDPFLRRFHAVLSASNHGMCR